MPRRPASREDVPFDAPPGGFGPGRTATENARFKSGQRAYRAGRKGRGFSVDMADPLSQDELREFYEQGRADAAQGRPSSSSPAPDSPAAPPVTAEPAVPQSRPAPPRRRGGGSPQFVNDGAGFLLGLFAYALFINFLRGGPTQARGWLAAKFLNRPLGAAPIAGRGPSLGPGGHFGPGTAGSLVPGAAGALVPPGAAGSPGLLGPIARSSGLLGNIGTSTTPRAKPSGVVTA